MKNNLFTPLFFLLVSVVLSTCSKQQSFLQTAGRPGVNYILIQRDGSFSPATLRVPKGSSITFVNNDARPHKITSSDNTIATGVMPPNSSFFFENENTTGIMTYQCSLYPGNCGTIIITPR